MKEKILNTLKSSEGYISGEAISEMLGISRTAVWKHIKKLKNDGYEIESVTKKGYRLIGADVLSESEIKKNINTEFIGQNITVYDTVDSTNNKAKENFQMPDGSVFISEVQTGGKGRLGRSWSAPRGSGIWMSLLLKPDIELMSVPQITLVAGLSVCRALGNGCMIKWPNDIIIGSRKICGILTEMSAETDRVNYVVCGIGININTKSFEGELEEKATSLFIETGREHGRCKIAGKVLENFEELYGVFLRSGLSGILEEYKKFCATLGRDVSVIYQKHTVFGKAVDVTDTGALVVEVCGKRIEVNSGEVSVRGIYGYI